MIPAAIDRSSVIATCHCQDLLVQAARERRAAEATRGAGSRRFAPTPIRRGLGSLFVAVGRRLQGAQPVGHAATAEQGAP
jgi:hypothetical protein